MKYIKIFIAALCFLSLTLIYTSCQKEYSYEGGPGVDSTNETSSYILEGEPGSCFDFSVNGNYNPGVPLTIDNSVQVMVNVLSVGPYSIKTATINGISFSSSGNFTTTGSQELILRGSGTPVNSGKFSFKPNSSNSTCNFDITCTNADPPSTFELAKNADGTCSSYSVPGSFYHGTPLNNNIMSIKVNVMAPGNFTISTNTVNGMTFSLTGNFTTIGTQSIKLIGRGTPKDVGIFSFTPQIIGAHNNNFSCSLDVYVF